MANNDFPTLDGIAPSWADITIKCSIYNGALLDLKDIAAINSGTTMEFGEQRGTSGRVMKFTRGQSTSEASITLYRSGYQKLIRNLSSVAPSRGNEYAISLVHFDLQIQHTPLGDPEIYEYIIKGCRVAGRTLNGAEGVEADKVEVPMKVKQIADLVDGKEVVFV